MKILKSLNRIFLLLFFVLLFNVSSFSNEPVDIWNLENNIEENPDLDVQPMEQDEIIINETISKNKNDDDSTESTEVVSGYSETDLEQSSSDDLRMGEKTPQPDP